MINIDHPQVYIYSYQLEREISKDANSMKVWADKLWQYFNQDSPQDFNSIYPSSELKPTLSKPHKFSKTTKSSREISGSFRFARLDDSIGMLTRIGSPETDKDTNLEVTTIQDFNPQNLTCSPNYKSWLGQTILITAKIPNYTKPDIQQSNNQSNKQSDKQPNTQLQVLANDVIKSLFANTPHPPFYRATELFNSPIFEYSSPQSQLQVFVYFLDNSSEEQLGKTLQPVFELFYHRHKITKAFLDSQIIYSQAQKFYECVETTIAILEENLKTTQDNYSAKLKDDTKQLFQDNLNYQRTLQTLQKFENTVNIHIYNYQQKLAEIANKSKLELKDLTTFNLFSDRTAPYIQRHIQADLGYFKHGTDLISTAIASIRGIVEIEQTEIDQERQEAEKIEAQRQEQFDRERQIQEKDKYDQQNTADKNLQDQIQAVGVGIAAGAIVSSTSGLITQPWTVPWSISTNKLPHPFIIASFLSISCSLGAWYIAKTWIQHKRKSNENR